METDNIEISFSRAHKFFLGGENSFVPMKKKSGRGRGKEFMAWPYKVA